jgi:nicotinamide mononucleotide (NMN) deamidase PncC
MLTPDHIHDIKHHWKRKNISYPWILFLFALRVSLVVCWLPGKNHCMNKSAFSLSRSFCRSTSSSRIMASPHWEYSMEGLENYAKALVGDNLKKDEAQRTSCCIAVAGGGGSSISSLASTSGASQMLLDGDITYSRKSYLSYVGLPSDTTGFYYTSLNAAKLASKAALHRAFRFQTGDIRRMPGCIGVGCTSALTSSSGEEESHAYIVATKADGMQLALNITLEDRDKTRLEEEICVSYWILRAIDLIQKGPISESCGS